MELLKELLQDSRTHSNDSDIEFVNALKFFNVTIDDFYSEEELLFILINSISSTQSNAFCQWVDHRKISLLCHAARNGYTRLVDFLLNHGAEHILFDDVEGKCPLNLTASPLITALLYSHFASASFMLQFIDENKKKISTDVAGTAMLIIALKCKDFEIESQVLDILNNLIDLAGEDIAASFKLRAKDENACSVLSHASMTEGMDHFITYLIQDYRISDDIHGEALVSAASVELLHNMNLIMSKSMCLQIEDLSKALFSISSMYSTESLRTAKSLLSLGAHATYRDETGMSSVSKAVNNSNTQLLILLLDEGGDCLDGFEYLDGNDATGNALECCKTLFKYLIKDGKYFSWKSLKIAGKPIISLLATKCPGSFVDIAIEYGADLRVKDDFDKRTPLDWACFMNNLSGAAALLNANADVNAWSGSEEWTCFHTSVQHSSLSLITLILSFQPDVNAQMNKENYYGYAGLHLAVTRGIPDIVDLLLSHPLISINIQTARGYTPLSIACYLTSIDRSQISFDIVKSLLSHGADPNITDDSGSGPLMTAVESLHEELIKILLDKKADIELQNESGDSPISLAADYFDNNNSVNIIKILMNSKMERFFKPESALFLKKHIKDLLTAGCEFGVVALGLVMLETPDTRKIITDAPSLWKVPNRTPNRIFEYKWKDPSAFLGMYSSRQTSMHNYVEELDIAPISTLNRRTMDRNKDQTVSIYPENMLTWSIARKNSAIHILLQSENKRKILPIDWRSNLCINCTTVGTPLECAIDEQNVAAIVSIMNVLASSWNFRFSKKSVQRNGAHPLDRMISHDLLYLLTVYPEIMLEFLRSAKLVPAYSWVSGLNRAAIGDENAIWVCLTKDRSPTNLWRNIVEHNKNLHQISPPWQRSESLYIQKEDMNSVTYLSRKIKRRKKSVFESVVDLLRLFFAGSFFFYRLRKSLKLDENYAFPQTYEIGSGETDVEAFLVPVKKFATYEMLHAIVEASATLDSAQLFESPIVVAVVQLHWNLYGFPTHFRNLRLYLLMIVGFQILVFIEQGIFNLGEYETEITSGIKVYLCLCSLFFIQQELKQIYHSGHFFKYITDPWNYLDLPVFMLIFIGVILHGLSVDENSLFVVHSVTALLLWCKALYFTRCFSRFGSMVMMIFQVMFDIKIFLVIFSIVMVGFANAFFIIRGGKYIGGECNYTINEVQQICEDLNGPGPFNTLYTALRSAFSYSMGNYDFDDLDDGVFPTLMVVIWFFFMLISYIILYNLLIAIISESYERLSVNKIPAWHLEKARVIVDIYAGLSKKDKAHIKEVLEEYPWLQVLVPKTSVDPMNKESQDLEDAMSKYPWLRYFVINGKCRK